MSVPNGTQSSFDHKQLGPTATASYESRRVAYHKYLDGKEVRRNQRDELYECLHVWQWDLIKIVAQFCLKL